MTLTDRLAVSFTSSRNRVAAIAVLAALTLGGNLIGLLLGAPEGLLPLPALPLSIPISWGVTGIPGAAPDTSLVFRAILRRTDCGRAHYAHFAYHFTR